MINVRFIGCVILKDWLIFSSIGFIDADGWYYWLSKLSPLIRSYKITIVPVLLYHCYFCEQLAAPLMPTLFLPSDLFKVLAVWYKFPFDYFLVTLLYPIWGSPVFCLAADYWPKSTKQESQHHSDIKIVQPLKILVPSHFFFIMASYKTCFVAHHKHI